MSDVNKADLALHVVNDDTGRPLYICYAAPGTAVSSLGWQICKCIYSADGLLERRVFANGTGEFKHKAAEAASYSYDI